MEGLESVRVFDQFEECSAVERGDTTSQASEGAARSPESGVDLHGGWAEARRREREKEKQAMVEIQARSRVVLKDFDARFDAMEGDGQEWVAPAAVALPVAVLEMDAGRRDIISRGLIDGSGEDVDQVFSENPAECLQRGRAGQPAFKTYVLCLPLEESQTLEWRESGAPVTQYESYLERWQRRQQQQQAAVRAYDRSAGGGYGSQPLPPPPPPPRQHAGGYDRELSDSVGATLARLQDQMPPPQHMGGYGGAGMGYGGAGGGYGNGHGYGHAYGREWRGGPQGGPPPPPLPPPMQQQQQLQQPPGYYEGPQPPLGNGYWGRQGGWQGGQGGH